jgi:hypothetical protein
MEVLIIIFSVATTLATIAYSLSILIEQNRGKWGKEWWGK